MRSIGVLESVRKKKHVILLCFLALGALGHAPGHDYPAQEGDGAMRAPSSTPRAVIGTDPETGARVMRTPEPRERESYRGPQTIILSPEVFPGRSGNRPPSRPPQRPRPPVPAPR